jgi:hypothetical protein
MPTTPASETSYQTRIAAFAAWRANNLRGDEKGEAQVFLDRLFRALGHKGIYEAGATLEFRVGNARGGTSFADLMWKPRALIEMKKAGTDLSRHYHQAFEYWARAVPDRPRYVILCNFDEFWIYDFENQLDEPVERVSLSGLEHRAEALSFLFPVASTPIFNNDLVNVTREAAADVAKVFVSLRDRGIPAVVAQRFSLQCVMAMFAEDIGLLPAHYFTQALQDADSGTAAYDLIGGLFREMNTPGTTAGGRYVGTPYFNGGLFVEVVPIELNIGELNLLRAASATIWSDVRPEIFGTLFEGSMEAGERHASGAHFTSQADIARIVIPTVVQPWREKIADANSIQDLSRVLESMSQYRVLDPSCGSGNFLYVAYREMRRLERDVIEAIRERRRSQAIAGQESFGYISPEQFLGIDINPFAVEVAKVTMLLGKKLADDEMSEVGLTLPLNNLDSTIIAADALFVDWPHADAIIGNPPYLGRRKMVAELGAAYVAKLDDEFGPKGVADFVTYWFPKAHDRLPSGGRAGYVATKSVKQVSGRAASLDYIVENNGHILNAIASMPWSGEANVSVAIINWQKGGTPPPERVLWLAIDQPPLSLDYITAALSPAIDLKRAQPLRANRQGVYQGQTMGIVSAFKVSGDLANQFIAESPEGQRVVHPLLGGNAMLHQTEATDYIIDLPYNTAEDAWRQNPSAMAHLESKALPIRKQKAEKERLQNLDILAGSPNRRVNKHHANFLDRWWGLAWRRPEYIQAVAGLRRYIAVTRVASGTRGPVFTFVDSNYRIEDSMVAFPFEDDYSFGILQSSAHAIWFEARCSSLGVSPRYTLTTVYNSFPWPQDPSAAHVARVAQCSANLNNFRAEQFGLGVPLADQYAVLGHPGRSTLRALHAELDAAVKLAYGFESGTDLLEQIFELNLLIATKEEQGVPVTAPGRREYAGEDSMWAWPVPVLP